MVKNFYLRLLTVLTTVVFTLMVIVGCTNKLPQKENAKTEENSNPEKISMMTVFYGDAPFELEGSEIGEALKKMTNVDLSVTWIQASAYTEKLNIAVAAGELKDIVCFLDHKHTVTINSFRNGLFWNLDTHIKSLPNFSAKVDSQIIDAVRVDGKLYSVPKPNPTTKNGIVVRKDWMENVGIKEIKTTDDLLNAMRAFTKNDPDKNGKADTLGMVLEEESLSLNRGYGKLMPYIQVLFGTSNIWGIKDGKIIPSWTEPGYIDAMNFFKKAYDEGLINKDFPVTKRAAADARWSKGEVGTIPGEGGGLRKIADTNPTAECIYLNDLQGKNGIKHASTGGYFQEYAIYKKSVDEKKLPKVLKFIDQLMSQEVQDLLTFGIKGVNFIENADGTYYLTDEQKKLWSDKKGSALSTVGLGAYKNLVYLDILKDKNAEVKLAGNETRAKAAEKMWPDYLTKQFIKVQKSAIPDYSNNLISDTQSEKGATLDKMIFDGTIKYILGSSDINEWNKTVEQWRKDGGDKIIDEYTKQYNANKGNK